MDLVIKFTLASFGAFFAALWVALVLWTYRDIQSRSTSVLVQILATLLVLALNVPGLFLYFLVRPSETLAEAYARALEEETLLREVESEKVCPTCRREIEDDFFTCPSCMTPLKRLCPCGLRPVALRWERCPYCPEARPVDGGLAMPPRAN